VVAVYQRMPAVLGPHRASVTSRCGQVRVGTEAAGAAAGGRRRSWVHWSTVQAGGETGCTLHMVPLPAPKL
jgi:hypothetical protein